MDAQVSISECERIQTDTGHKVCAVLALLCHTHTKEMGKR